jgi:ABC-2 type transport system ATP-binding protein
VLVRSPRAADLALLLKSNGATVQSEGDDALAVTGMEAPAIAALASDHRIAVHELATRHASLEQAYLDLTGESVQYRAGERQAAEAADQ